MPTEEKPGVGCSLGANGCRSCGKVSSGFCNMITMHQWFDPLTDFFFRPFIRPPRQGAATAIHLLLDVEADSCTGTLQASCHPCTLSNRYTQHSKTKELWDYTEAIVKKWL